MVLKFVQLNHQSIDWWMFAATLAEHSCHLEGWGLGAKNPSKLLDCLAAKLPSIVWNASKNKLE
jgi:hypothetical protein